MIDVTPPTGHTELYAAAGTFFLVLAQWITAHLKGRNRDRSMSTDIRKQLAGEIAPLGLAIAGIKNDLSEVRGDVTTLTMETRDLKGYVIGPDGENGLRGDVREIKARVIGLEDRERDALAAAQLHGPLDRRAR
jgi:hypothetical protein